MSHTIYLSLGTNLGDRLANLRNAITTIAPKIEVLTKSSVYETEPWGYSSQPDFLNLALKGTTELDPTGLLTFLKQTEVSIGRQDTFRFGPRMIDLDILFFDDLILETASLTIPHPRITERAFVLVPLCEIAPQLIHPRVGKSIQQLKSAVDTSSVRLFQSSIS